MLGQDAAGGVEPGLLAGDGRPEMLPLGAQVGDEPALVGALAPGRSQRRWISDARSKRRRSRSPPMSETASGRRPSPPAATRRRAARPARQSRVGRSTYGSARPGGAGVRPGPRLSWAPSSISSPTTATWRRGSSWPRPDADGASASASAGPTSTSTGRRRSSPVEVTPS